MTLAATVTADVIIVGAGLAGLICGQQVSQAGKTVLILEKSRGLGGRLATRRINESCWLDHGCPAWFTPPTFPLRPDLTAWLQLTSDLRQEGIIQAWQNAPTSPKLLDFTVDAAPQGMTAIAKVLAKDLRIQRQELVLSIQVGVETGLWQVTSQNPEQTPQAWFCQTLILAMPAPQAYILCQPLQREGLAPEFLKQLKAVTYDPCLTLMAGFHLFEPLPPLPPLELSHPSFRSWAWDSRKRPPGHFPTLVVHSSPEFAQEHFDQEPLADIAADLYKAFLEFTELNCVLAAPAWQQIHRWRYAQVKTAYPRPYLVAPMSPTLICCGDWGGTDNLAWGIGRAWQSGMATAALVNKSL